MAAHCSKKVYRIETKIISPSLQLTSHRKCFPRRRKVLARRSQRRTGRGCLPAISAARTMRRIVLAQRELKTGLCQSTALEGGGAMWMEAQRFATKLKLKDCRWCDYADESQSLQTVLASSVIIATQRREARGLLWPSKLAHHPDAEAADLDRSDRRRDCRKWHREHATPRRA